MKFFNQFYYEAIVLAKKSGVEGKLDKSTGEFAAGNFSDAEKTRYAKYSATPAPTPTPSPTPAPTSAPVSKPKDERPTNRQVAAAKAKAEYQKNARNLRLGVELGGAAADQARQNYATQNSPAARAAKAKMAADNAGTWRTHQFTLDSPAPGRTKDRDYGIPTFHADRRRENHGAMVRANMDAGMSRQDAERRATTDEAELDKKNVGYQNYRNKKKDQKEEADFNQAREVKNREINLVHSFHRPTHQAPGYSYAGNTAPCRDNPTKDCPSQVRHIQDLKAAQKRSQQRQVKLKTPPKI